MGAVAAVFITPAILGWLTLGLGLAGLVLISCYVVVPLCNLVAWIWEH